jgi:single-strand DNA-binding protein
MMANEAYFSVAGYIATDVRGTYTRSGVPTVSMRLAWTPRRLDKSTGEWTDEPSSFASVRCFRNLARHAAASLRKGDPVIVTGTLRVREYEASDGSKRTNVDVLATSIGPDLSRKPVQYSTLRPLAESAFDQPLSGEAGGPDSEGAETASVAEELTTDELTTDELGEDIEAELAGEPVGAAF